MNLPPFDDFLTYFAEQEEEIIKNHLRSELHSFDFSKPVSSDNIDTFVTELVNLNFRLASRAAHALLENYHTWLSQVVLR